MAPQQFDFSVNLVEKAEKLVNQLDVNRRGDEMLLTYAQLRKVLSNIIAIKNKLSIFQAIERDFKTLPEDIIFDIRFLKTSLLYQAGRIEINKRYPMKDFLEASQLLQIIDSIGDNLRSFEYLCKYIEAIIAFYKYRSVALKSN